MDIGGCILHNADESHLLAYVIFSTNFVKNIEVYNTNNILNVEVIRPRMIDTHCSHRGITNYSHRGITIYKLLQAVVIQFIIQFSIIKSLSF